MKRLTLNTLLATFIGLIVACNTGETNSQSISKNNDSIISDSLKNTITKTLIKHPVDTFYNNLTKLIGGMDSIVTYNNNWDLKFIKKYAKNTSQKTKKIETNRLQIMSEWNASNLERNKQSDSSFVF
ncbi:MAG: hypothetical protein ACKVG7_08695, partial [Flavobacteriales bacterium]